MRNGPRERPLAVAAGYKDFPGSADTLAVLSATAATTRFAFFDELPEGAFVLSENGVIVFWNRQLAAWTGIEGSRAMGTELGELFPDVECAETRDRLIDVFREGTGSDLPEGFGEALLAGAAPDPERPTLRGRAVPLPGLDVCRYALVLLRQASSQQASEPEERERLTAERDAAVARGDELERELAAAVDACRVRSGRLERRIEDLERSLEIERSHGEEQEAELEKLASSLDQLRKAAAQRAGGERRPGTEGRAEVERPAAGERVAEPGPRSWSVLWRPHERA